MSLTKINPCVLFRSYVKSVLCDDKCSVLLIQNGSNLFVSQIKPNQYTLIYSTKQSVRAQKRYLVKCLLTTICKNPKTFKIWQTLLYSSCTVKVFRINFYKVCKKETAQTYKLDLSYDLLWELNIPSL